MLTIVSVKLLKNAIKPTVKLFDNFVESILLNFSKDTFH